ncbi:MAG: L-seryl-tRNA(Sec) selenium transferase [Solirubrobacteraceae bacterium]
MSTEEQRRSALRALPSVDRLATELARATLAERRAELLAGALADDGDEADLVARALDLLRPSLRPVINATGVIVHTNLGRAPLAPAARAAVARAVGYCNLELDLETGERGSRHAHVERTLCELTGAEAAIAVNNGAGALLLAAAALAGGGGELIVSRGQLIEIGGGFRIPEVVAQAGARLVEVGTTNRTRLEDYSRAIGADTGALLRVHTSNFRALGFVEQVEVEQLCTLGPPVIDDIGSGVLVQDEDGPLVDEPSARRSVAAGAALVCFSGDKLLGGPQAGLLVGSATAVAAARSHPLARALRIDKLSLAALDATLALHRDPELARSQIPVLAMLFADAGAVDARAQLLAQRTGGRIVQTESRVGGGALPLLELSGPAVALDAGSAGPAGLARALRLGDPAVLARVHRDSVLLDPRTLSDEDVDRLAGAVRAARAACGAGG